MKYTSRVAAKYLKTNYNARDDAMSARTSAKEKEKGEEEAQIRGEREEFSRETILKDIDFISFFKIGAGEN